VHQSSVVVVVDIVNVQVDVVLIPLFDYPLKGLGIPVFGCFLVGFVLFSVDSIEDQIQMTSSLRLLEDLFQTFFFNIVLVA